MPEFELQKCQWTLFHIKKSEFATVSCITTVCAGDSIKLSSEDYVFYGETKYKLLSFNFGFKKRDFGSVSKAG